MFVTFREAARLVDDEVSGLGGDGANNKSGDKSYGTAGDEAAAEPPPAAERAAVTVEAEAGDGKPNTLLTRILGSKGLGINSSCRVGKGGGGGACDETKTSELSVVRRELDAPMFSSETLCRK